MAVMDKQQDKYIVAINTSAGLAIIESPEKWQEAVFVGAYIERSRRAKVGSSNKVRVSAFFTNSPEDAR